MVILSVFAVNDDIHDDTRIMNTKLFQFIDAEIFLLRE